MVKGNEMHTVEYWQSIHRMTCYKEAIEQLMARIKTPERYVANTLLTDPKAMKAREISLWMLVGQKQLELGKDG